MEDKIEQQLREHFADMIERYPKLRIRFEFSEKRGVFLVSYLSWEDYESDDGFFEYEMGFEDKMSYLYCDDAPLFTLNEKYLKLSGNAEEINADNINNNNLKNTEKDGETENG